MNFDFSDDQKVLRDQAKKFLGQQASSARVRRILESDTPYDVELWRGMAENVWRRRVRLSRALRDRGRAGT
jgi:hypothetical protein